MRTKNILCLDVSRLSSVQRVHLETCFQQNEARSLLQPPIDFTHVVVLGFVDVTLRSAPCTGGASTCFT